MGGGLGFADVKLLTPFSRMSLAVFTQGPPFAPGFPSSVTVILLPLDEFSCRPLSLFLRVQKALLQESLLDETRELALP